MHKTTLIVEPGKQVVVAATVFDASREKVFELFINPKLIPQWWGPRYLTTKVEKMEVKPGGMWRFIQHDPEGNESGFHGVYHEVIAPKRVTYTFEYEGMPGHILMETVRFEDQGGKTKVTSVVFCHSTFSSVRENTILVVSFIIFAVIGSSTAAVEDGQKLDISRYVIRPKRMVSIVLN